MQQLILTLSNQLPLSKEHIQNIIKLLEEGATILLLQDTVKR